MTKQNYYDDIFKLDRHNAKKIWGIINTLIGKSNDKTTISEAFKINNSIITNHDTIADEFCSFFSTEIGPKYAREIPKSKSFSMHYMHNRK